MVSRARFKFNHGCTYCALRKLHTYLWYCLIPAHPNWTEEPEMRADATACCTIHVLCMCMYPAHWWWQLELTAGSKHQVKTCDDVSQNHITCIYMHRALWLHSPCVFVWQPPQLRTYVPDAYPHCCGHKVSSWIPSSRTQWLVGHDTQTAERGCSCVTAEQTFCQKWESPH